MLIGNIDKYGVAVERVGSVGEWCSGEENFDDEDGREVLIYA